MHQQEGRSRPGRPEEACQMLPHDVAMMCPASFPYTLLCSDFVHLHIASIFCPSRSSVIQGEREREVGHAGGHRWAPCTALVLKAIIAVGLMNGLALRKIMADQRFLHPPLVASTWLLHSDFSIPCKFSKTQKNA